MQQRFQRILQGILNNLMWVLTLQNALQVAAAFSVNIATKGGCKYIGNHYHHQHQDHHHCPHDHHPHHCSKGVQVHWQGKGWGYTTSHACIFPNLKISNIFHMQIGERGLNRPPPSLPSLPPDFVLSAENESRESFIEDVFTGSICPV